ncbi:MAG: tRNA pseudouridine(13) synthase TruD [Thermosphaera sp.]
MTFYPHPIDYAVGLKHVLTHLKLDAEFEMTPDTFIVEEIVDFQSLGFSRDRGEYAVLKITKRSMDTLHVKRIIAGELGIPESNLIHLGLKDKESTSTQYFFVKRLLLTESRSELPGDRFKASLIGYTRFKPSRRFLIGNSFTILVEGARESDVGRAGMILGLIEALGLPSYYGYQRFGVERPVTHLLGKYFLTRREDLFSRTLLRDFYPWEKPETISSRLTGRFPRRLFYERLYAKSPASTGMSMVDESLSHILIEAYSSYLFNLLLNKIIDECGWACLNRVLPTPGCKGAGALYYEILKTEGLTGFNVGELGCWWREGLFRPSGIGVSVDQGVLRIRFTLNPGLYASIVLRELFKENLILK